MAETAQETSIRNSIKAAMQKWLDAHSQTDEPMSYIAENTASIMADAAFAVLLGMADLEAYFKTEQMMR